MLINNEAHDRVSSFLLPEHFFDPVHARIYEVAATLIGSGKQATPITLRTFFEIGRADCAQSDRAAVPRAFGGQRHDHHQRGRLRPHDLRPRHPPAAHPGRRGHGQHGLRFAGRLPAQGADRGGREPAVLPRRDRQVRPGLHGLQHGADARHRDGQQRLSARRRSLGHRHGLARPRCQNGRPAGVGPDHHCRPARHGQVGAGHQHRLQRRQGLQGGTAVRRHQQGPGRRGCRLVLAGDVGRAARHPHYLGAGGNTFGKNPPRHDRRDRVQAFGAGLAGNVLAPALHRSDRRHVHRPACGAGAEAQAPERAGAVGRSTICSF